MKNIKIILLVLFVLFIFPVMAQGGPPATPIDGGLSFLLALGGAYGIKRFIKAKKEH